MTSTITWDVVRASGFVAYALVSLSVIFGLFLSLRVQSPSRWPRLMNYQLHQHTLLLAALFSLGHGLFAWLDPFMRFHGYEVLVPFMSHYRPLWIGFGILAFYLGIFLALSTWLRPRLGYRAWRLLHYLSYAVFILATIHGLGTGSDTNTRWALAVYALAAGLVALLTIWRFWHIAGQTAYGRLASGAGVLLVLGVGVGWTIVGPLSPDWSAVANNGHGSGARIALVVIKRTSDLTGIRDASIAGALNSVGEANGQVAVNFTGHVAGTRGGLLLVQLTGLVTFGGNVMVQGGRAAWEPSRSADYFIAPHLTYANNTVRALLASPATHRKMSMVLAIHRVTATGFNGLVTLVPVSQAARA
ncbi:MAG: ferric reductase-like transmembrane domain-containing protein [Firmicutes bacterium]|nr:ferric reductase-like transmembrane domain-containing protein [Bacillota bacterium]